MTKTNTFSVPKAPLASIVLMILSAYANASDHAVIHNTVLTERLSQSPVHEHNASDSIDIENVLFYLETMKVEDTLAAVSPGPSCERESREYPNEMEIFREDEIIIDDDELEYLYKDYDLVLESKNKFKLELEKKALEVDELKRIMQQPTDREKSLSDEVERYQQIINDLNEQIEDLRTESEGDEIAVIYSELDLAEEDKAKLRTALARKDIEIENLLQQNAELLARDCPH